MSYPHPRQRLFDALEDAVQRGVFPGCVAFVECDGATVYHEAHGSLASHAASVVHTVAVERDTVYDLSSLTKVLATTTLWALLVSDGAISLDQPVPPRWSRACPGATLLDLLEHRAGLVAHREFFALIDPFDHEAVLDALARTSPASSVGSATVYSDLGFMILGAWLSDVIRRPLEQAFRDRVAYPLQLDEGVPPRLDYRPLTGGDWLLSELERRIAPTEVYEPVNGVDPSHYRVRHGIAHGVVHDDNAFVMGGVAGHAGLFGTAEAVVEVARAWLQDTLPGLDLAVRDRFWQPFPA
ncbi:MAG: serine hydrolase, partial [bacterium]|nr:serine hydrolase [bacterium]